MCGKRNACGDVGWTDNLTIFRKCIFVVTVKRGTSIQADLDGKDMSSPTNSISELLMKYPVSDYSHWSELLEEIMLRVEFYLIFSRKRFS